jgi:uncharacterized protein (TIGR03437 family)
MSRHFASFSIIALIALPGFAAEDRITTVIDNGRTARIGSASAISRRHLDARDDRGPVDAAMPIAYATLYLQPAAGLEMFLAEQQNPSSPNYRRWLTPEQFGDRFGLSGNDIAKLTQWLRAEGLTVHDVSRGRTWITFSGSASQVSRAFHTEIHRYVIGGEQHFANTTELAVPAALQGIIAGMDGLDDFHLQPFHRKTALYEPDLNSGRSHYLAPDDLATIYDINSLYANGIDGTGQKLVIIGQTDIRLSDIQAFRARFNLPANDPQVVLYGPDPGLNQTDLEEADLDIQVSGAIARNATIIYVNSRSVTLSAQYAVDQNLAPAMSMSYGGCEIASSLTLRSIAQQANAQGITWMISSGDSAAATCDRSAPTPQAEKGATVSYPSSLPEVTSVGGTEFDEGAGAYWGAFNSGNSASAVSYIPERAWNDTPALNRLDGGGGGASAIFPKPIWQAGPGVPNDGARDVPDVSFSSSGFHDGYFIVYNGLTYSFGGTSASSPLFAGVVALLNQSLQAANPSAPAGVGNINPVLYRLAQATTDVFHDVTVGDNIVPCAQQSPDCVGGTLGYAAAPGYDRATGLGSVDVARLIAEWSAGSASTTLLTASPASFAPGDSLQLTATVAGSGSAPTGTVTFVSADIELGSSPLSGGTASITVDGALLAGGTGTVGALYSGDGTFLPSAGTTTVKLQLPAAGSYVIPSVTPNPVRQVGSSWPYVLKLTENAGVATTITAFTVNGVNNLPGLPSTSMAANGGMSVSLAGGGLTVPLNRVFHFEGKDDDGTVWSRDLTVPFVGSVTPFLAPAISITASPSTVQQNPQADPSCQWSTTVTVQELSGYQVTLLTAPVAGLLSDPSQAFGTARLAPRGMLSGTVCIGNATAPSAKFVTLAGLAENGAAVAAPLSVTLAPPSPNPARFTTSAAPVTIAADSTQAGSGTVALSFDSGSPAWNVAVLPAAARKWLKVSAASGSGNATLSLEALGDGMGKGVYYATLAVSASDALPQSIEIPIIFVIGASPDISISGMTNAASGDLTFAPGELVAVYGNGLASGIASAAIQPLPLTLAGASATVNGVAAPLWFVSPGQINLQIPYETPAGTAVLGITNGGSVATYALTVAPAAPGIFAYQGSLVPNASGAAGQTIVAFITGDGDVTPSLATGATAVSTPVLSMLPHSRQSLTVTIGGEPAKVVFNGIVPGLIGVTQVNFTIPGDLAAGMQPVMVSVGGVSSAPVNLNVTAPN